MTAKEKADILRENLVDLTQRTTKNEKIKLYELAELAEMADIMTNEPALPFSLEGLYQEKTEEAATVPMAYMPLLRERKNAMASADLAAFASFLSARFSALPDFRYPWEEKSPPKARICYLPSPQAEAAYAACAAFCNDASVYFADGAEQGCEAVVSGEADYVLLPYITASGLRFSSTEKLIKRYDLYTAAAVNIAEEERGVLYGLFAATNHPFFEKDDMLFALRFTAESYAHMGYILSAFGAFEFSALHFSSHWEDYDRVECHVVLKNKGNYMALWTYLYLYANGFSVLGRFPLISGISDNKE